MTDFPWLVQGGIPQFNYGGGELSGPNPAFHPMFPSIPSYAMDDPTTRSWYTQTQGSSGAPGGGGVPTGGGGGNSPYGPYQGGYQFPSSAGGTSPYGPYSGGYQFDWTQLMSPQNPASSGSPGWMQTLGQFMGNSDMGWGDLARGGLGAYLAYDSASGYNQNLGGGPWSQNQQSSPWGPSTQYRTQGMDMALQQLMAAMGQQGGGGGGQPFSFLSQGPAQEMFGVAQGGSPLYGLANQFAGGALSGAENNPYRQQVFNELEGFGDPLLDAFILGNLGDFTGQGGGGTQSVYLGGGGGGGGYSAPPGNEVGAANYIRDILGGQYLSGNPHLDDVIAGLRRDAMASFNEDILPSLNSEFEGSGRYGGSARALALGEAGGDLEDDLAGIIAQTRFSDYSDRMGDLMGALSLGTQWDQHLGNLGAQYASIDAQNQASSRASGAQMAGIQSQENIARLGAMLDAMGLRSGMRQFGEQGRIGLSDALSGDQNFALSMVPELSGLPIRDYQAALDPLLALDQLRLGEHESRMGRQASNARYNQQLPWSNLTNFANLINAFSGGYGSSTAQGVNPSTRPPVNPWTQALGGFYGGATGA